MKIYFVFLFHPRSPSILVPPETSLRRKPGKWSQGKAKEFMDAEGEEEAAKLLANSPWWKKKIPKRVGRKSFCDKSVKRRKEVYGIAARWNSFDLKWSNQVFPFSPPRIIVESVLLKCEATFILWILPSLRWWMSLRDKSLWMMITIAAYHFPTEINWWNLFPVSNFESTNLVKRDSRYTFSCFFLGKTLSKRPIL